jgi:hypothetical protein
MYQSVYSQLEYYESQSLGKIIDLKGTYAFKTKSDVLVTALHHGSEIYGTYEAATKCISELGISSVPVVDIDNFNFYSNESEKFLVPQYDGMHECFVQDFIRGYNGYKPKKLPWMYLKDDSPSMIKEMQSLIDDCRLVIDLHNSCADKYFMITSENNDQFYKNLHLVGLETFELYSGDLGMRFKKILDGVYRSDSKHTILSYAKSKGIDAVALEIPVFEGGVLKNFSNESDKVVNFIKQLIEVRK